MGTTQGEQPSSHNAPDLAALAGRFVVFDGPDGSGKTTQFRRLAAACSAQQLTVCEVREPGGTHVGERIRTALLEHSDEEMNVSCEMLLYMASRAQLVQQRIRPSLERGELVLADRFVSSTLAYQGTAGGISIDDIQRVAQIATQGLDPDLVVIFDVDADTAAGRLNPLMDRMEAKGRAFHTRVREGYLAQVEERPDMYLKIDARQSEQAVWEELTARLVERFREPELMPSPIEAPGLASERAVRTA